MYAHARTYKYRDAKKYTYTRDSPLEERAR